MLGMGALGYPPIFRGHLRWNMKTHRTCTRVGNHTADLYRRIHMTRVLTKRVRKPSSISCCKKTLARTWTAHVAFLILALVFRAGEGGAETIDP